MGPTDEEVLSWFDAQPVVNLQTLEKIRDDFASLAQNLLQLIPPCADRTTALRELAAVSRTAVFAFTHNQEI